MSANSGRDFTIACKPGHFWELEQWMFDTDTPVRELALLCGRKKTAISRVICGQFVRVDYDLQVKLAEVTAGIVGDEAWRDFLMRRLQDRKAEAAA